MALAEQVGHILVATADKEGQPHVAADKITEYVSNKPFHLIVMSLLLVRPGENP